MRFKIKQALQIDFFSFAQKEQKREAEELINSEELIIDEAKRYILTVKKRICK